MCLHLKTNPVKARSVRSVYMKYSASFSSYFCNLQLFRNESNLRSGLYFKMLKYVSKICGLNVEIVAVLLDHVSGFSHSDSISKLWQSRIWFLRFFSQNRFEFQNWNYRTFLPRGLQLSNFAKLNSYYCWLQISKKFQVCYVGYKVIAKRL